MTNKRKLELARAAYVQAHTAASHGTRQAFCVNAPDFRNFVPFSDMQETPTPAQTGRDIVRDRQAERFKGFLDWRRMY